MTNRSYEAPRLDEVGTLAELTQASNQSTTADGHIYQVNPQPGVPGGTVIGTLS